MTLGGRIPALTSLAELPAWCQALHEASPGVAPPSRPERISTTILDLLSSSQWRKGSLEAMQHAQWRRTCEPLIRQCILQGEPIQFTLMAFPFKVPNPLKVMSRCHPDLAEVAALRRFAQLDGLIRETYPPGMELLIIHDGGYLARVFGVPRSEVGAYEQYFARLVHVLGLEGLIRTLDFGALIAPLRAMIRARLCELAAHTRRWMRDPNSAPEREAAFRKTLGMLNLRAVPLTVLGPLSDCLSFTGTLPALSGAMAVHGRVRRAMRRYYLRDLVLRVFDPRRDAFPQAIHLTTTTRRDRLALWLVERGRGVLPWHGVGVLELDGRVHVRRAVDVASSGCYRPVRLDGEGTPFFYERVV